MALIKLGGLAQDVRGSLNGTVFSRNRGGAYVRSKVSPLQPVSEWSSMVREGMKACAQRWAQVLEDGQRASWDAFAAVHPFTNVFGDSIILAGVAMFAAVNQRVRLLDGDWIDDIPETFVVGDLGEVTAVFTAVAGSLTVATVTVANDPGPYGGLYIYGTVPRIGGSKVQKSDYRLVNLFTRGVLDSGVTFHADYMGRFPLVSWVNGQKVSLLVAGIDLLTGAVGPGRSVDVILAA